jgi:mRNA interferase RelE/StbE
MTYRAVYTEEAARQIRKLDNPIQQRIRKAVERLCIHPELGKRLTGVLSDRWSYRIGDWRILYRTRKQELLLLVLTIGHRREVYRV